MKKLLRKENDEGRMVRYYFLGNLKTTVCGNDQKSPKIEGHIHLSHSVQLTRTSSEIQDTINHLYRYSILIFQPKSNPDIEGL